MKPIKVPMQRDPLAWNVAFVSLKVDRKDLMAMNSIAPFKLGPDGRAVNNIDGLMENPIANSLAQAIGLQLLKEGALSIQAIPDELTDGVNFRVELPYGPWEMEHVYGGGAVYGK